MGKGFSALIEEVVRRPLKVDSWGSDKKGNNFIQYHMRYDGCLHYEILDGCQGPKLKDDNQNLLYEKDVAYVELHFERQIRMSEELMNRLKFFTKRLGNVSAPFRFIPQWAGRALGFALRYVATESHLGGVPCPEGADVGKIRDELEGRLRDFIAKLDPVIEKLEEEEKSMAKLEEWVSKLKTAKQIVLSGAPGTGKTFLARQIARSMVLSDDEKTFAEGEIEKLVGARTKFVQFHPSYDYTDFVEGLRPIQGVDGQVGFRRQDGTFKKLCKAAIEANECGGVDNFDEVWKKFVTDLDERHSIDNPLELTTPNGKSTFKVFANRRDNLSLITSGADKVQGSLTRENVWRYYIGKPKDDYWKGYFTGVLSYLADGKNGYGLQKFVEGKPVKPAEAKKFVMIIDEINRGDISKIFGELFYAIDDGYRGPRGRVETQYQNLVEEDDVFADGFYVPENVYIIGTMNDIDRNVESMDFAIRRRFTWEEIKPSDRFDAMMTGLKDSNVPEEIIIQAKGRMERLNDAISDKKNGLGPAYQIGPSYFTKIKNYSGEADARFEALWEHHIRPLLCEYLRGMPNADDTVDKTLKQAYDLPKSEGAHTAGE